MQETVTPPDDTATIEDGRRPTLSDVARLARVSTATASRALSNPGLVSEATRLLVMAAAEQTNYRPNLMARSLRKQQAQAIIVLVPNLDNAFFVEILRGLEQAAHARGYSLVLGLTFGDQVRENSYVTVVENQRADGLILLDGGLSHLFGTDRQFRIPAVQVVERVPGVDLPYVKIDDRAAAAKATRHLLDLGHRRIAHISGQPRYSVTPDRIAGYRQAIEAAGLVFDPEFVVPGNFEAPAGEAAARQLMSLKSPPTAIFCGNDLSAIGAMTALRDLGLSVPGDISLVGFDDVREAALTDPPLTTVRQPRFELGFAAMTLLLDILGRAGDLELEQVLPVEMILRESTAPYSRKI